MFRLHRLDVTLRSACARAFAGRSGAPMLVLAMVGLTAVAGVIPLGVSSVSGRDTAASTIDRAGARPEPLAVAGGARFTFVRPAATAAVAAAGGTIDRETAFGSDGRVVKPIAPAPPRRGVAPLVRYYRALRGDSIWSISRRFGIDTMTVWWANVERLRHGLRVGQLLAIAPTRGVLHMVVEGDTLASIAFDYRSTPERIVAENGLRGDVVVLGQQLMIPDGKGATYPKGLLPERRPAAVDPSIPVVETHGDGEVAAGPDEVAAGPESPIAGDGLARLGAATPRYRTALEYGTSVRQALGSLEAPAHSGVVGDAALGAFTPIEGATAPGEPSTGTPEPAAPSGIGTSDTSDGGYQMDGHARGAGARSGGGGDPAAGGDAAAGGITSDRGADGLYRIGALGDAATGTDRWGLVISEETLADWGATDADLHQDRLWTTPDDATLASRQIEVAAARVEARAAAKKRAVAKAKAAHVAEAVPPLVPAGAGPREGDSGIADEDQRTVPALDPVAARRAAANLRADISRYGGSHIVATHPGQKDLPATGETVFGVPTKAQLLKFPSTGPDLKAHIDWLSWPLQRGRITQLYWRGHHGVDIVAAQGSLILSAASGQVVWAGWRDNGGGYQVWVRHAPGVYTTYNHMSKILVRVGQKVPRGKAVGVIGSTGYAFGTHLHFEVWRNGVPGEADRRMNPLRYTKPA